MVMWQEEQEDGEEDDDVGDDGEEIECKICQISS